MPSRYIAESVVGTDGAVRVPASVCSRFDMHPGDTLEWAVDGEMLVLRVVRYVPGEKEVHVRPVVRQDLASRKEPPAVSTEPLTP